ncbi:MAG: hypothetical protein ACI9F9_002096 [Candidatus Paceibacteria bacterium]|jgi:hypothetical protein
MSMNCNEVQAELPLFVGGDLESPGREWVAEHLGNCDACGVVLGRAVDARALLTEHLEQTASIPTPSVWPDLRQSLLAEGLVHGATNESALAPTTAPARGRLLRFLPSMAAAAALMLLGSVAGRWFSDPASFQNPAGPFEPTLVENGQGSGGARGASSTTTSETLPVKRAGMLEAIDPLNSFASDARLFQGEVSQPSSAFPNQGVRTVSDSTGGVPLGGSSLMRPVMVAPGRVIFHRSMLRRGVR